MIQPKKAMAVKLTTILAVLFTAPAQAATAVLKGLPRTFSVTVEPLDQESRQSGLTEAGLTKVVQNRLARNKLAITSAARENDPDLYVRVVVLTSHDVVGKVLGYGAHIEVSCREKALLKRDPSTDFLGTVWFKGTVTVANPQTFVGNVARAVAEITDQFLADDRKENGPR